jgi:predicted ATPase/DNA-binding winged helix-turn-helix (wHTH) protein
VAVFRFDDCEVDAARRELRRSGELVHLEPQAFDLLAHLIEHRDRVVSKIDLLDGVWGHRFVSEANLTTRVKEARRAVGDDGTRQAVIRNVRGRGYRFVADVTVVDSAMPARARSGLIGRDAELAAIVALVASAPLVTILGPGGVGKSALARTVAAEVGGSFSDGSHIVELAALEAGADVSLAVAGALDVIMDRGRPDDGVRSIARLDALLVLDNCEHVADETSHLVDRILAASDAKLRILATSQVRLGIGDEAVVAVTPLSMPDASALFAERARAVVPGWSPEDVGADRLDDLVSRLDRLPLTIEMAAARLSSMSFEELDHAIADETAILRLSHRAPTRRHRSLGSVVAWSTDLLEPDQRELFRAFSVFAGRVSAADAGAVVAPKDPVGAQFDLAALAERSLLVTEVDGADTRYSMLMTMRAVAARGLEQSGAADEVRRRHAEHTRDVLQDADDRLRTPDEATGRLRLAGVVDEARAAFRWAGEHDLQLASDIAAALHLAAYSTIWLEPAEWCRPLNREAEAGMWGAAVLLAGAAIHRGEFGIARRHARSVADAAQEVRLRAIAEELLAEVALYNLDLDEADRATRELRRLGDELGDAHFLAFAAVDAALTRSSRRDPLGALDDLDRADLPPLAPTDAAWLAYARGDALGIAGDRAAVDAFREAIELGSTVGSLHVVSLSRTFLAIEHTRLGEHELALDAYAGALRDIRRHGNYADADTTIRTMVELFGALGEDRGATMLAAATSDYASPAGSPFSRRIASVVEGVRSRVGESKFAAWDEAGARLTVDDALRLAAELVDEHR